MLYRRITALLVSFILAFAACACALAEGDADYEGGDPALSLELMLRTGPTEGHEWTYSFQKGDVADIITEYKSMEELRETDSRTEYEGEGGYTLARVDGMAAGIDLLTLVYSDDTAPLSRLSIAFSVDEALNVSILAIGTDDAQLPEAAPEKPIHPVLLLKANPVAGHEGWVPDNSYMPGLSVESEYIPAPEDEGKPDGTIDMELVTLSGTGEDETITTLNYGRTWEPSGLFLKLSMNLACYEDTGVEIFELCAAW